jgi:hypothetical protein
MPDAKLTFNGSEYDLNPGRTSLGRASDNKISFSGDSNISRYHAEIEAIGSQYFLIDLGSANGTTLNGNPVGARTRLESGDEIELGGSSKLLFEIAKAPEAEESTNEASALGSMNAPHASGLPSANVSSLGSDLMPASPANEISGSNMLLIGVGSTLIIAAVVVVGAAAFYLTRGSSCDAKASIVSPESGDTIIGSTDIEIDVSNSACVGSATFKIDGADFATVDTPPFSVALDAKEYPDLADGFDHAIAVELKDIKGNAIGGPVPIMLAFETREVEKPKESKTPTNPTNRANPTQPEKAGDLSLIDIQEMSKRLVTQFSGKFSYNISNKDFLVEVRRRTSEYAQEGYFDRASRYRDAINVAYVREQNVDAALGFMLAMSRSKFVADKQGSDEGLWRMSNQFAATNAYNGSCGTETLSDPSQHCAANASALYMKAIVYVFDGDPVYSAVVFGRSPQDAVAWKTTLPANRSDIWNVIKTPAEREQLIRFFAAGIVAENPQKFGLKKDRPLSELYKLTM